MAKSGLMFAAVALVLALSLQEGKENLKTLKKIALVNSTNFKSKSESLPSRLSFY